MELNNELMCSFEVDFIVKISLPLLLYFKWIFLKILEFIYFSSFTITVNFPYHLVTNMCELVLKDKAPLGMG